jgi:Flp pilus assembly protein TadD
MSDDSDQAPRGDQQTPQPVGREPSPLAPSGWGPALLIALLAFSTYANALGGSFHFDDAHAVVENPSIRSLGNVGRFFVDASTFSVLPQNQNYRPPLLVTYALTAAVTGVKAGPFIFVNLLVHLVCALLVRAALRRILRLLRGPLGRPLGSEDEWLPTLAAVVFAVHPLFSECVNYVSARSESLSAALALGAVVAYLRAREDGDRRWLAGAAVAMLAAVITKAVVVTVPIFVLLLEVAAAERHPRRQVLARFAALFAPAVAGAWLVAKMTPALAVASASSFTRSEYLRSSLPALLHYAALFVWPVGQSADPHYPVAASWGEARVITAGLVLLAAVAFAAHGIARRRHAEASLAIAWFVLCLLPSQSFFPLAEVVNEHRPYLATAALCALLAAVVLRVVPRLLSLEGRPARLVVTVVAGVLVVSMAALTNTRNRVWRSEETLWKDVVVKAPRSARAQMNYGLTLMSSGKLADAEPFLREAVRLAPLYAYAHINLGNWLLARGRTDEARWHLDRAVAIAQNLVYAHYYRGLAAERLQEPPAQRVAYFKRASELSPTHADAHYHLALARDAAGDLPGAEAAARRSTALRGSYDDRFMLAYLVLKRGDVAGSVPLLQVLLAERPGDRRVQHNLEWARKLRGK